MGLRFWYNIKWMGYGLEPSPEFLAMAEKEKRGEMTLEDIKRTLDAKYRLKKEMSSSE